MPEATHTLTQFEYPVLVVGAAKLANDLRAAFESPLTKAQLRRAVYVDHAPAESGESLANKIADCIDPRYQAVFLDATDPVLVDDRVLTITEIKKYCPATEIVVVIGKKTEARLVELLQAGAWYFLQTPITEAALTTIMVRVVAVREADALVRTDGLTGLFNRAFFEDALRDTVARLRLDIGGQRTATAPPVSLLLADLDGLKEAYGDRHQEGEMFLREMGGVVRKRYRPTDVVARIGGDEFGALLVGMNYTLALMRAELLRKETLKIPLPEGVATRPTLSVGVVTYPSYFDDPQQMYWQARRALERAKAAGGNVVFGFDATGTPRAFVELGG